MAGGAFSHSPHCLFGSRHLEDLNFCEGEREVVSESFSVDPFCLLSKLVHGQFQFLKACHSNHWGIFEVMGGIDSFYKRNCFIGESIHWQELIPHQESIPTKEQFPSLNLLFQIGISTYISCFHDHLRKKLPKQGLNMIIKNRITIIHLQELIHQQELIP